MSFRPNYKGTLALTANGTTQNAALPNGGGLMVRLQNAGPQIAFVEFTSNANLPAEVPGASGGAFPVFANQPALEVTLKATDSRVAYISSGNSTVYLTRGDEV